MARMVTVSFPDSSWRDAVGPVDGVDAVVWDPQEAPPQQPVDVYIAPYMTKPDGVTVVAQQPSVRLVQLLSAGFDNVLPVLPEGVSLANAKGVHDAATAELALTLVLASQRGFDDFALSQAQGEWGSRHVRPGLADKRVLLLGYGSVGRAIVERLVPFEVSVTAVASRARAGDDLVEAVHGVDELAALAPQHDVIISVLPGSDATHHILGQELLSSLPDGMLVVNVGRGPALDTEAALRHAGRLRFALDVTDPEPLPTGHPLWSAPGVIISPHVGGATQAFRPRAVSMLRRQLAALAAGEPPINLVHEG